MEDVKRFFRNLLIILALLIPSLLVIVVKALEWMTKRICACVRRVFQFFNANTSAMPRTEPTITVRIRGNGTVPVTSGNIDSRRVITTTQNMKNKKPYKEKKKIKTNEEARNCRVSVPFNATKQLRANGCILSKDNFQRTGKVAPTMTRSFWGRKTSNYNQERKNVDKIKTPLMQQVVRKDLFHKTDSKSTTSLNSATCSPRRLYSDARNTNVSWELRNHHNQGNHILTIKPLEKVVSSAQCSVRLWSVDLDAEAITPGGDHQRENCRETNENNVPESATKELEEIMAQSSNSETSERSNDFCCNRILMVVADAMVVFVLGAMQPICGKLKAQLANIEKNQRIKRCSSIFMAVAIAMVLFVLVSIKPVCSYVTAQLAEARRRINQCCRILMAVRNATMSVVLDTMQSLCENRQVIKDIIFRFLSRTMRVSCDLITSAILAFKSIVAVLFFRLYAAVSQLRSSRPTKQEDTFRYSQFSDVLQNPTDQNDKQPAPPRACVNLNAQTSKCQRRNNGQQREEKVQLNASPTDSHAHLARPSDRQVKVSTKRKVKDKGSLLSVSRSNVDEPVSVAVGRKMREKKVATAAHFDLQLTTSVAVKNNEKATPRLITPFHVNKVASSKAHVQEFKSPRVGLSNLLMPAKVNEESETSSPRTSDNKSLGEIQEVIERRHTESETISTNVHASKSLLSQCRFGMALSKAPTEVMQKPFDLTNILNATAFMARPRENIKRKADGITATGFKYEPTVLDSAERIAQLAIQNLHGFAVDQSELMEVGESVDNPFSITCLEEMEEPPAANTLLTAQVELASASSNAELEIEDMETVEEQASVWNFFSFSLPSFLTAPFKFQSSEEEMEVDEQTAPFPRSNLEHEKQEEMETNEQPFVRMDTKKPLASAAGMFDETSLPVQVTPAEQHMMQSVTQPQVMHQAVQSVLQPVTQPERQSASQSVMQPFVQLWAQAVMREMTQPAMQSVIQPVVQSAMQQVMQSEMQRPLVQRSPQPNAKPKLPLPKLPKPIIDHSDLLEYNTAVVCGLNNETSEGEPSVREFTATGQTLTSEVIRQNETLKSRDRLIMEQLQLVPSTDPACYLAEGLESEDDSDDEYELDLETIENFSVLEKCPDHAQFLTKLLIEKEASERHNVSKSDCSEKQELTEFLGSEITGKCSEDEFNSSLLQVERLEQLQAKKESSPRQCNM